MFIVEHKSRASAQTSWQVFRDTVRAVDMFLSQRDKITSFPVAYGVIVYTGKKLYNYSTNIFELFGEYKQLASASFTQPIPLLDLSTIDDHALALDAPDSLALFTMKHLSDKKILPHVDFWRS